MQKLLWINLDYLKNYFISYPINRTVMAKINELKDAFGINDKLLSPDEIITKAEKFNSKECLKEQFIPTGKFKDEEWAFGEYKIFNQVFIYYIFQKKFDLQMIENINITDINERHYHHFQNIFITKGAAFIKYQFLTLFLRRIRTKREWSQAQTDYFNSITKKDNFQEDWRRISKDLFNISNQTFFRTIPQCRERWKNYQSPNIVKSKWNKSEDEALLSMVEIFGLKWSMIAKEFKGSRNDHQIKNRFKCLQRKLKAKLENNQNLEQRINIIRNYINQNPYLYSKTSKTNQDHHEEPYQVEINAEYQEESKEVISKFISKFEEQVINKQQIKDKSDEVQLMDYQCVEINNPQNMEEQKDEIQFYLNLDSFKAVHEKKTNDEDDQQYFLSQAKSFFSKENTDKFYDIFGTPQVMGLASQKPNSHKQYAEMSKLFGNDFPLIVQTEQWFQNFQQKDYYQWI